MSRVAILSDIHANLEALDAVLADVDALQLSEIACLGDFVGYGASPNECLDRLRPRLAVAVLGNHDAAALGLLRLGGFHNDAATTARWTQQHLEERHRGWLESLPYSVLWRGLRLVHASPSGPEEWNYVLSVADADQAVSRSGDARGNRGAEVALAAIQMARLRADAVARG